MLRPSRLFISLFIFASLASLALAIGADSGSISVRDLMQNVAQYPGNVQIEGVVAQVYPENQLLGLIDRKEYAECNSVTCAKLILPVSWTGNMPKLKEQLLIKGVVGEDKGKMLFVAENLEKLKK